MPLSINLVEWAHSLVFMHQDNYKEAVKTFQGHEYFHDLQQKAIVLDIPDTFDYMAPELVALLNPALDKVEALPKFFRDGPINIL